MQRLNNTCLASLTGSVISSVAWADNITSVAGMIGTIISAVFGLLSLFILIYNKLKTKADNNSLTAKDLIEAIKEGKEGAEPFIAEIKEAVEEYEKNTKGKEDF